MAQKGFRSEIDPKVIVVGPEVWWELCSLLSGVQGQMGAFAEPVGLPMVRWAIVGKIVAAAVAAAAFEQKVILEQD